MKHERRDSQLRCPVCNGLLQEIATKRGLPKWCGYCGSPLPPLRSPGARRLLRRAKRG